MCFNATVNKRKALDISTEDMDAMDVDDDYDSSEEARYDNAEEGSEPEEIYEIHDNDVLSGRGIASHPGNVYFREICTRYQQAYATAPRGKKMDVASEVALEIEKQTPPGRFLDKTADGKYVIMPASKVLEKTSQALRDQSCPPFSFVSSVPSPLSQGMIARSLNESFLPPMDVMQQLPCIHQMEEVAQSLSSSNFAVRAVPYDPYNDTVSELSCESPQEQPMSNQGGIFHEREQLHPDTDKMMLDADRFCDAAEDEFNTSMAVFYYCLRNGYLI